MKKHFIVKNEQRETSEYNLNEAVEVLHKYRQLQPEDQFEIHSFMNLYGIKKDGEINQRLVFKSKNEAESNVIKYGGEIVECRCFDVWFRRYDEKDFLEYYSDEPNLEKAVDEVLKKYSGLAFFAINYDGEKVAKYNTNLISKK